MSKRVAIYARVSTTRQAENDISIPDQIAQTRKHCEARGWYVVREFVDPGASARDDKRPQFQAMMDAGCVDPSPFDIVLVHSQSRFFRDTAGYVVSKRRLQKHGVSLVSMTQDFGEGAAAEFAETIIAAADALHSAETAKHVSRTMLENARQGFWNGSKPPLGYRTIAVEQRGQRTKKRLEIDVSEAETVRLIFKLFLLGDGRSGPMGIKDIASWLNAHGHTFQSGGLFYTSAVHAILTRDTYSGTHYFNRHDTRANKERPKEEWVAQEVPAIIPAKTFKRVRNLLSERRPNVTPPRISNSDVLLTGIVRCECCGAPLMVRTGKSGRYRYYACASHRLKGSAACSAPAAIREDQLDDMVLTALAGQLMTPERLPELLAHARKHQRANSSANIQRRAALRKRIKDLEQQIDRLYHALREGMVTDTGSFRAQLAAVEREREEAAAHLSRIDSDVPEFRQTLSHQQAAALAATLQRRLLDAPKPLKRRYVRGLVSGIILNREKAVITGPSSAIAATVTSGNFDGPVLTSVREWRTGRDSNQGLPESKSGEKLGISAGSNPDRRE
jgi:DNA invertase Pin-like site-specific DNA recombinase